MQFCKPQVEFVPMAMNDIVVASGCTTPEVDYGQPSDEWCNGPDALMNNCETLVKDGVMF